MSAAQLEHYRKLHDALSDMIEDGHLSPQRIPIDQYLELVRLLTTVPPDEPKAWTVLLLRPDYIADDYGTDTYMTAVEAVSAAAAAKAAQTEAYETDHDEAEREEGIGSADDYAVLLVIEGDHKDVKP